MASYQRSPADKVEIDLTLWPIVVVTPPTTTMTSALVETFMHEWTQALARRSERYVCINDLRHAPNMAPAQRRKMTDWMNAEQANLAAKCCGAAMIFDSAVMRGALTAMLWMFRPPYPTEVFKTRDAAVQWARTRLATAAQAR